MSVWLDKLKARVAQNPLYFMPNGIILCQKCGGTGKKVPMYRITNYNEFRTCSVCKVCYR